MSLPGGVVLAEPLRLWLLLLVAAVAAGHVLSQLRRPRYTLRFTQLDLLDTVAPRRPRWRPHVVAAATVLGLALLVLAAARPQVVEPVAERGAAVVVVLDTSLSMEATDVEPDRFTVAREAAVGFVESVPQPIRVGLVSFNGVATIDVVPTTDRDEVVGAIGDLTLGEGTAIGDATVLGVEALRAAGFVGDGDGGGAGEEDGGGSGARLVLLSDGDTTVGRTPAEAAGVAVEAGVAVSTIAYGTPLGTVTYQGQTVPVPVNGPALAELAEATGGVAYDAESEGALEEVYDDIGETLTVEEREVEVTDRFVLAGLAVLVLAVAGSLLWSSRIP